MAKRPSLPAAEPAPQALVVSVDRAKARTRSRRHGPPLEYRRDEAGELVTDDKGRPIWDWPFLDSEGESPSWSWLVLDAFGTRNPAVAACFVNRIMDLCADAWDEKLQCWVPDDTELSTMLHVISAMKPRNEAEAMLAAERASTSMLMAKVAQRVAKSPHDTRMISAYARLAIAAAAQTSAIVGATGRKKAARQSITVRRENHIHYHQHAHLDGGVAPNEGQAHAESGAKNSATRQPGRLPALPRPHPSGEVVPFPGSEGEEGLPDARRRSRVRRSEG